MENIDGFLDTFMSGEYFIIFLALMLIILIVLIVALIKSREEYKELLLIKEKEEVMEKDLSDDMFEDLVATANDEVIDENKPLIKQIDTRSLKTYDDEIDEYEFNEEENAVISTDDLLQKARERREEFGVNSNQVVIQKYEEEQENKAIISYEQLLKNASNITLTYKEEKTSKGAPRINKIEVSQKEVSEAISYLKEEEFLGILKDFRMKLE